MVIDHGREHLVNAYTPLDFSEAYFVCLNHGGSYEEAEYCGWNNLLTTWEIRNDLNQAF